MSKDPYTVTVNGRVWESCGSLRGGIRLWKTLANNSLFKNCSVKLFDENWKVIREKKPEQEAH